MARGERNATVTGTTFETIFLASTANGSDYDPLVEVVFIVSDSSAKALRVYVDAEHKVETNYGTIEIGKSRSYFSRGGGITTIKVAAEDAGTATYTWDVTGT